MMKQIIAATAFAILTLVSAQSNAASPSTCAVGCVNGVFVNAVGIGCASGDNVCVCKKTDSFYGGIRDCITQACAPQDVPSVQIPLANAYGDSLCARYEGVQTPTSAPTTSTQATPTPTPSETGGSTTPTVTPSMSTPISSADPFSSGAAISAGTASTASDPATIEATPTTTPALSLVTSSSSSPTAPSTSASSNPATTSGNTTSSGLSTAVKAGIGAGVGAAALAANYYYAPDGRRYCGPAGLADVNIFELVRFGIARQALRGYATTDKAENHDLNLILLEVGSKTFARR
ncbi:hypothetical protein F4777DRAFT_576348 [Nemania sp. FL0916]|nr:hypothetical protein F4777DRAFT_576348 [Nemania sp. FL0916]